MNAAALRELLKQVPFEPFEIVLSSGDRYPVRHPELLLVLQNRVLIALEAPKNNRLPDQYVTVSYLHIAAAEPMKSARRGRRVTQS